MSLVKRGLKPEKILTEWPRDTRAQTLYVAAVSNMISKAPSSPLTTAGYPPIRVLVVLQSIAPGAAIFSLLARGNVLSLLGKTSFTIPSPPPLYDDAGNPVEPPPAFIEEGKPIPFHDLKLTATELGPVKTIKILSGLRMELEESSPTPASIIISRMLADRVNASADRVAFLTDSATNGATSGAPASLLHGITALAAAAAGSNAVMP